MKKIILTDDQKFGLKEAIVAHIRVATPELTPSMVADNLGFYTKAVLTMPMSAEKLNATGFIKINSKSPVVLEDVFEEDTAVHIARLVRSELAKELVLLAPMV